MKVAQMKQVFTAVQYNVSLALETKGEAMISGLEGFTIEMEDKFFDLYDAEMARIITVEGKGEVQ